MLGEARLRFEIGARATSAQLVLALIAATTE